MRRKFLLVVIAMFFLCSVVYASSVTTHTIESPILTPNSQQLSTPMESKEITPDKLPVRYDSTSLDSFIRAHMETAHIPGVATWVMKNGQVIWQQCYGYANLEDSIEVADSTLFSLASISKTITATAIMQLWERGLFNLDDNINDYLPFDVCAPDYPDSVITFRMLMTHTSSIHDNDGVLNALWVPNGDSPIPLGSFLQDYLVPGGAYYSVTNYNGWVPGASYEYSNVAIGLLGYLVEAITDSFPIHCQDSIFDPLSMNHTSWFLSQTDTHNLARPYTWYGSAYGRRPWWGSPFYPAHQLKSSSVDLAQHVAAIMQYGILDTVRILDSTTVELIASNHLQINPTWIVGLVWHYIDWLSGRWTWCHNGAGQGVDTYMGFCPAESSAVVSLANCDNYGCSWNIADALFSYAQQYTKIEEQTSPTPIRIMLEVSPNPFSKLTTVNFSLEQSAERIEIDIYDAAGRLVRNLHDAMPHAPCAMQISWEGDDNAGKELPDGVYFVTLRTGNFSVTNKVLMVR